MTPPLITVGSMPTPSSSAATIDVVVVLPCVPAMATVHLRRISSASMSARRTTGIACSARRVHFRVAALDGGGDHQRADAFDILGLVADHDLGAALGEPIAHWRSPSCPIRRPDSQGSASLRQCPTCRCRQCPRSEPGRCRREVTFALSPLRQAPVMGPEFPCGCDTRQICAVDKISSRDDAFRHQRDPRNQIVRWCIPPIAVHLLWPSLQRPAIEPIGLRNANEFRFRGGSLELAARTI